METVCYLLRDISGFRIRNSTMPPLTHTWGSEITSMRKQSSCALLVMWVAGYLGSTWLNQVPFLL